MSQTLQTTPQAAQLRNQLKTMLASTGMTQMTGNAAVTDEFLLEDLLAGGLTEDDIQKRISAAGNAYLAILGYAVMPERKHKGAKSIPEGAEIRLVFKEQEREGKMSSWLTFTW